MKIGIIGDTHLTNRSPVRRIDDYWETLYEKVQQALKIFDDRGCEVISQSGDFFDSSTVACKVQSEIIRLLCYSGKVEQKGILCCYGQHDISGHSKWTLPNSPLVVLEAAGVVKILKDEPVIIADDKNGFNLCFYGASFGEPVPKPYEDSYNVLVAHRMVGDRPLWPGQELVGPRTFLRKHPEYNLIIVGDYHYRFIETWDGRTIINPGAIVRKTISKFDLDHKPAVVVFDTDTNEAEVVELDVKPIEEVFDLTRDVKRKDSKILSQLVEKLKSGGKRLVNWKHFLVQVLEERKSNQKVRDIIDSTLEEVKMKRS